MADEIKKDTVDYRDPTPFDDSKLQSLSEVNQAIRHKMFNKDVREPIAQGFENLVALMQEKGGNQAAEVIAARGNHELLQMREDAQDNAIAQNTTTLNNKFDTVEAQNYLKTITVVPETFANLAAIKAKYPSGANGLMVAADNGHKYIWTSGAWTDAGVYQSVGIASESIDKSKLKFPSVNANVILGHVNIDLNNAVLTVDASTAFDCGDGYVMNDAAQSIAIPSVNYGPRYYYYDSKNKTFGVCSTNEAGKLGSSNYLFASTYRGYLFKASEQSNVDVTDEMYKPRPASKLGTVVLGDIIVDYQSNKLTIAKGSIISSGNTLYRPAESADVQIELPPDSPISYVCLNSKTSEVTIDQESNVASSDKIELFALYGKTIYDLPQGSRVTNLSEDVPVSGPASYIYYGTDLVSVVDTDDTKTITILGKNTLISDRTGKWHQVADVTIDYSDYPVDVSVRRIPTLFFGIRANQYYVDYVKRDSHDLKVFSIFGGRVYGTPNAKQIEVNGVGDGGWEVIPKPKYNLMDWYQAAKTNKAANIVWLGDSTWAGSHVSNPDNIFPIYLNTLLPNEFTGVTSFNCSKSGYSTKQLYENFDTLTANATNVGLLMIGGGLNDYANIADSKKYLDLLVQKARDKGWTPVIVTTQATSLLYADTSVGGDWTRTQTDFAKINKMKRQYAHDNDIDLLDFEKYTHDFIEKSPTLMSEMFTDYLHGQDPIHIYEASLAMTYLSQPADVITDKKLVGITTTNARSNVSYNLAYQALDAIEDGFKVKYAFTADGGEVLLDYQFLITADSNNWILNGFNAGVPVTVTVDGVDHELSADGQICNLGIGYHHVVARATNGAINFKGLKIEQG